MRGFAQPQDLFLDLGEPLETDLDREIATRCERRITIEAGRIVEPAGPVLRVVA